MKLLRQLLKHPQLLQRTAAEWDDATAAYKQPRGDLLAEVVALIKEAHVVVIEVLNEAPTSTRATGLTAVASMYPAVADELPLAPPFAVCWIEALTTDGNVPLRLVKERDEDNDFVGPVGVLIHELRPGVYDLFVLEIRGRCKDPNATSGQQTSMSIYSTSVTVYRAVDSFASELRQETVALQMTRGWLGLLNDRATTVAVEDTAEVVLLPRPDRPHKRKPFPIRRIVRIMPKRLRGKASPLTQGGVLDWTHRWEVWGHWRRVKGLGKDRAGEYCVAGYTWVNEFVKGPSDKPLIRKTREFRDAPG